MLRLTLRRLVALVPLLFIVTLVVWGLLLLIPGDPAQSLVGDSATPEQLAAVRESYNPGFSARYELSDGAVSERAIGGYQIGRHRSACLGHPVSLSDDAAEPLRGRSLGLPAQRCRGAEDVAETR